MSTPRLQFENVSKRFAKGANHDSLRDLIPTMFSGFRSRRQDRFFWALQEVSFLVEPGQVLGIIGGNGAGKSTSLKLLNRIMQPTSGRVTSVGRVGSLIEVSAGFHQDLTGRQNIYLQAAIMGMSRSEVRKKFEEIVDFAGLEDFIDTPVKRYSSGMNARLGFSIAAHLEPDILIIDEVLAVGDHAFQEKAFGRIKSMARRGSPVVLVSHQLDRVAELCSDCILLNRGTVKLAGTPRECINEYLHGSPLQPTTEADPFHFSSVSSLDGLSIKSGDRLGVLIRGISRLERASDWVPAIRVVSLETGAHVHSVIGTDRGIALPTCGHFEFTVTMDMNLPPGGYSIQPHIVDTRDWTEAVSAPKLDVEVIERLRFFGTSQLNLSWDASTQSL